MITINSDGGRIGSFWWLNADTTPVDFRVLVFGFSMKFVRYGTCGFGSEAFVRYGHLPDLNHVPTPIHQPDTQ